MTTDPTTLRIAALEARVAALESGGAQRSHSASAAGEVADDADLDGQYGNEPIRKMPSTKYWSGDDFVGVRLSDCSPEFLDAFARYKDACAFMNEKKGDPATAKYTDYDRRDARRARGWRQRILDGVVTRAPRPAQPSGYTPGAPAVKAPTYKAPTYEAPAYAGMSEDEIPF